MATKTIHIRPRAQTVGEELANSISHGIASVAAVIGLPVLIISAQPKGQTAVIGAVVFGVMTLFLYFVSTMYHSLAPNRAKRVFQRLDHSAIFLMIAGTYTPFTLGVLRGPVGWTLFAIIWTLAIAGVVMKATIGARYQTFSNVLYLAMGWLVIVAAKSMWTLVPGWGLFWLVAGGLSYTVGIVFFATDHHPYRHFIWHLFVMTGTTCHFMAVWRYAV
ncbi:MAG: hemolysin III family protein [Acidobacteria bacterium]|nr:hemolysin III family protein [Acidobacteriota bacterium]